MVEPILGKRQSFLRQMLASARLWTVRAVRRRLRPAWVVVLTLFCTFSLYRGLLWLRLSRSEQPPWGFVVERFWLHEFIATGIWDAAVSVLLAAPFFWILRDRLEESRRVGVWAAALAWSLVASTLSVIHLRMTLDRGEQLGAVVFEELISGTMTVGEAWAYGELGDYLLMFSPVAILLLLKLLAGRASTRMWRRVMASFLGASAVFFFCSLLPAHKFPRRFHHNPIQYGTADVVKTWFRGRSLQAGLSRQVSDEQRAQLMLVDEQFVQEMQRGSVPARPGPGVASGGKPWNVVLVIIESAASDALFEITEDGTVAMPFLYALAQQSWWMQAHYSTANSSHRSVFSLMTGLYPSFGRRVYCLTPDIDVPTVSTYLPQKYSRFLVTPGDLRSYFPRRVLIKSGFSDLSGRAELLAESKHAPSRTALHEFDGLEAFQRRVQAQKEPFFATYYTYSPHFGYRDYGERYRVMKNTKLPRNRYINNLRLVDDVLSQIVTQLKELGMWERTVLMVMGDHGEAFGQHTFHTHANDMHEEEVRTPWLVRYPGSDARLVEEPTSHVDVLPTLLDILGLPYEAALFQGESLFNPVVRRRYVFAVGNEQSFISVSREHQKVLSMFGNDSCRAYDLVKDPFENEPFSCAGYEQQTQALADFRLFQTTTLQRHSTARKKGIPLSAVP